MLALAVSSLAYATSGSAWAGPENCINSNYQMHLDIYAPASSLVGQSLWNNTSGNAILFSHVNWITDPSTTNNGASIKELVCFAYDASNSPIGQWIGFPSQDTESPYSMQTTSGNWNKQGIEVPAGGHLVWRGIRTFISGNDANPNLGVVTCSGTEEATNLTNPGAWSGMVRLRTTATTNYDGYTFGSSETILNGSAVDEAVNTVTILTGTGGLVKIIQLRPSGSGFVSVGQAQFVLPTTVTGSETYTATINWGDKPGDKLEVQAFSNSASGDATVTFTGLTTSPSTDSSAQHQFLFEAPATNTDRLTQAYVNTSTANALSVDTVSIISLPGFGTAGPAFTFFNLMVTDSTGQLTGWANCQVTPSQNGQNGSGNFPDLGLVIPPGGKLTVTAYRPAGAGTTGTTTSAVTFSGSLLPAVQ